MKSSANDGDGEEEEDDGIENKEHSVFNHCFSELPEDSEAKPVSPAKYVHEQQLLRQSLLQQQRLTNRGANDSGSEAKLVSPAKYVHEQQLLRQSLLQQQRLTNGAPMASVVNSIQKWSTKEISKALVTEDNIAPIPVDPIYSQAGQGSSMTYAFD